MFSIDFQGIDEYKLRVNQLKKNLLAEAQAVTQKATFDMQSETRDKIEAIGAIDTGNMSKGIQARMESANQGIVKTTADYSGYVEHGTVKMRARPYFAPSFEKVARWYDGELRAIAARV